MKNTYSHLIGKKFPMYGTITNLKVIDTGIRFVCVDGKNISQTFLTFKMIEGGYIK